MNKTVNQIKNDLRFIKRNQKAINTYLDSQEQYRRRLEWLKSQRQTRYVKRNITGAQRVLDKLRTDFNIRRLQSLEELYLQAIDRLDDENDKIAIIKFYLQGKTMFRVANDMGYSADGIKSRLDRAIVKIRIALSYIEKDE